ncbi:N-lysine methyltransferase KMT5A-A-like [Ruditapes philippinarum]|uniref:N-lysine methyltransferase KMT5A-A-like n=1 Tax=Ruditapes philippinarum TaxID=129788 RepID=UPI00295B730D|nr:N-lysine methyltransferase KMT5A-A-like [Ruditapes philippinarum]
MASGNRKRCSRKTPNKHAEEWIKREEDPPGFAVRFFENKGRGVITTTAREKGEFLLVYRGEVVTKEEGERREEKDGGTGYRLFYKASGKQLW